MTDMVLSWLGDCPLTEGITLGSLCPGPGTGLFPKGITRVSRDILGGSRMTTTVVLRHRDRPDARWAEDFALWVLHNQPAGYTVTPQGGRLVRPTNDGWGTWEIELTVTQQS